MTTQSNEVDALVSLLRQELEPLLSFDAAGPSDWLTEEKFEFVAMATLLGQENLKSASISAEQFIWWTAWSLGYAGLDL